ncbi:MAG: tetratricopeptide repeat protein, partial [Acidobacteriota bacterium]|nr:tetratricopeptide repeat protein [Acidobacteriota bacterium]
MPRFSIREQLQRILASSEFAQAERMCRFLRLVVEYTLEDRAGELKEYLIGVEVFDRKDLYDPRLDPIVRVEARRLRSKLKKYYEGEGKADEAFIELPKGSYVPVFGSRPENLPGVPASAIAVLPFANLSAEEENEYFSDGLAQELIHGLTRVEGLRVVAWNSAEQLKGKPYDIRAIGARLSVGAVLTGSVRKAGDRVRIAAQLIDAPTSLYLWSEVYDRQLKDLLAIQDEISRAIVETLRIKFAGRLHLPLSKSCNPESHNFYLRGRFHLSKRTAEGINRSVECFESAIAEDPGCALSWAGLADACALLADYGLFKPLSVMPRAKQAALRAIELDPSLGEAWTSLALIRSLYEWQWAEGEICYRRAIELNPGYATVHHWYGVDYLAMLGRFDEALSEIERARQMDPLSTIIIEGHAFIYMLARQYDVAIRTYREALELDPFFYKSYTSIGRTLIQKGQYAEAIEMLERGRSLAGDSPNILAALGQAHALAGDADRARGFLNELQTASCHGYVPSTSFAIVYLGLGENERALDM